MKYTYDKLNLIAVAAPLYAMFVPLTLVFVVWIQRQRWLMRLVDGHCRVKILVFAPLLVFFVCLIWRMIRLDNESFVFKATPTTTVLYSANSRLFTDTIISALGIAALTATVLTCSIADERHDIRATPHHAVHTTIREELRGETDND